MISCRLAGRTNFYSTQFNRNIFERLVSKFTNLEGLNVEGRENDHGNYNLTKLMLKSLIHLNMIRFAGVDVYYIDEIISNVKNLEIFIIDSHEAEFYIPFRNISQISNSKAIHLENNKLFNSMNHIWTIHEDSSTILIQLFSKSNIRDLIKIRYFRFIYSIPFDCISQKCIQTTYFEMIGNLALTYVNPQFWLLPNLETVIFDYCRINETNFNYSTFSGYGDKDLKVLSDGNDLLRSGSINIDNGFRYLANDKYNNSQDLYNLELFVQTFNPCATVCSVSNGSYSLLSCLLLQWKMVCGVQFVTQKIVIMMVVVVHNFVMHLIQVYY